MDFPTIILIIIGVTVVVTVMAAGGLGELFPPKAPAPRQPSRPATIGEDSHSWGEEPHQAGKRTGMERAGAPARYGNQERDDPADNFFSDEDDFTFREPDYNRGAFSQREEDRDSLEDPDRNR
ncbi:MAG TPA: hypothetical protein VLC55_11445 [Burkholderiales bacterium]|nr:hypothetical protein [Burkholderiales bacterium]